jgi:hypothetical protein
VFDVVFKALDSLERTISIVRVIEMTVVHDDDFCFIFEPDEVFTPLLGQTMIDKYDSPILGCVFFYLLFVFFVVRTYRFKFD